MKFFVKNKIMSLGGNSRVYDEADKDIYVVKGKMLSLTNKKKIFDMNGKLLYIIKNKLFNFWTHSSYIFNEDKQKIARVKNRSFKGGFDVLGYGDEISIDGWGISGYSIIKNGEKIGTVKSNIALADNYEVEVKDGEDAGFLAAVIIAIDNVKDKSIKRWFHLMHILY